MDNLNFDLLTGVRNQKRLVGRHADLIQAMEPRFTRAELESLLVIHHKLRVIGPLDKFHFKDAVQRLFAITDDLVLDRIFLNVDFEKKDGQRDGAVSVKEWFHIMTVFLRGTLEERMKYCFSVYDIFNEAHLTRRSMYQFLQNSLHSADLSADSAKEYVLEFCDILVKNMSPEGHGRVSFKEYRTKVLKDRNMLEFLGQCFPTPQVALDIFSTFSTTVNMSRY